VQITSALPIAKMVGSNRTVLGNGIVHVVGDANISPDQEKELRRKLLQQALETLEPTNPEIDEKSAARQFS
jgi:glycine reductase complex component B subunit gamma